MPFGKKLFVWDNHKLTQFVRLYDKKLLQYSLASYEYVQREARIDVGNALHRSFMVRKILRIDFTYFMLGLMFFWPQGKSVLVEKKEGEGRREIVTFLLQLPERTIFTYVS